MSRNIKDNLDKIKSIFSASALKSILRWSKPVRIPVLLISGFSVLASLLSLGVTLVTKNLIDGSTGGDVSALWR